MADGATAATPYGPSGRSPDRKIGPTEATGRTRDAVRRLTITSGHPAGAGPGPADHAGRRAVPDTEVRATDGRWFRDILGRFATGVVAITAIDPDTGGPTGLAANSFTSVSLDPPLISFCVAHTSTTWPKLRKAERHCVNILSAPQQAVCLRFAAKGGDKFAGLGWTGSPGGGPVIDGALAWLECSVEAEYVAGDHVIVVARVHHLDRHDDDGPLIFYRGSYGRFQD